MADGANHFSSDIGIPGSSQRQMTLAHLDILLEAL